MTGVLTQVSVAYSGRKQENVRDEKGISFRCSREKGNEFLNRFQIAEIAQRQLADYDLHHPGRVFEDASISMTVPDAYQVQIEVAALRAARGEPIAGYKIGCVSEAVRRQLGLDQLAFGHLFTTEVHRSGVTIDVAVFECLAIEAEFGIRIAVDIPNPEWLREYPERSVAAVFAVIELHNNVFRDATPTPQELIANNAFHAGLILPLIEGPVCDAVELNRERIIVFRNGENLGVASGNGTPGGPFMSLLKVAEHLARFGSGLKQDQIVLTGSALPMYSVQPGDHIVVRCLRLAEVEMTVA